MSHPKSQTSPSHKYHFSDRRLHMDALSKLLPLVHVRRRWRSRPSGAKHSVKQLQPSSILDGVLDISKEASDAIAMQEQQVEWTPFEIAFPPDSPASASGRSCSPIEEAARADRKANPPVQTPPDPPPSSPHPYPPSPSAVPLPLSRSSTLSPPPLHAPTLPDVPASGLAQRRNFKGRQLVTSFPIRAIPIPPMPTTPPPPRPFTSQRRSLRRQPRFNDLNNVAASPMCRSHTFPRQKEQQKRDSVGTPPPLSPGLWVQLGGPWRAVPGAGTGAGVRVSIQRLAGAGAMGRQARHGSSSTRTALPLPLSMSADGRQDSQDSTRTTLAVPRGAQRQISQDSTASTTPPGTPTALPLLLAFPLPPRATFTKRLASVPNSATRETFGIPTEAAGVDGAEGGAAVEPLCIVKRVSGTTAHLDENSSVPPSPSPSAAVMDELFESLDDVYADYRRAPDDEDAAAEGVEGEAASLVSISLSSDEGVHPLGTSAGDASSSGAGSMASSLLGDLEGTWRTTYSLAEEYAVLFPAPVPAHVLVPAPPPPPQPRESQKQTLGQTRPCPYSVLAEKTQNLGRYRALGSKSLPDLGVGRMLV
ncbi:hypothetical protein C8F04DRAFT_466388 [Mycena alexandri]|uniref:Uncharacterized protein n=1 Tax=Mycena alexandri TaxID=1745969 RepID=A0AAD6T112_9AGAR|nr:hypothetical protein C8F04DRAFT_466388 [Mycena alexandri]